KDLMHDFNTTAAIVGLLSATYFYAYAGLMIPAGLCIDAFGVRRVVSAGGLVMGFGTVAMGLAATPWALFAARFAVGLGAATTFIGALKVAATWFPPGRFGFLSAVTATVGFMGALASTAPLALLVPGAARLGAAHGLRVRPRARASEAAVRRPRVVLLRAVARADHDPRRAPARRRVRALLRDGRPQRRLRAHVAARPRGESA